MWNIYNIKAINISLSMTTHLDTLFENALYSQKKEKLLQIVNEIVIEIEFIICIDLLLLLLETEKHINVVLYIMFVYSMDGYECKKRIE